MSSLVFLGKERIDRDPEASERLNRAFVGAIRLAEEIGGGDYRAGLWLVVRASFNLYLCGRPRRYIRDLRGLLDEFSAKTGEGA